MELLSWFVEEAQGFESSVLGEILISAFAAPPAELEGFTCIDEAFITPMAAPPDQLRDARSTLLYSAFMSWLLTSLVLPWAFPILSQSPHER